MDSFEKSVIGIARTDQALNKIQMIVGGVAFLGFVALFGVIMYKSHKAADKAKADEALKHKAAQATTTQPTTQQITSEQGN